MLDLGRKPFQLFFTSKLAKIVKDKCTHRSTNTLNALISTHRKPSSLCGYTPLVSVKAVNKLLILCSVRSTDNFIDICVTEKGVIRVPVINRSSFTPRRSY